jgi:beta-mannan synthase
MAEVSPKVMIPESFQFQVSSSDIAGQLSLIWELLKAPLIVPLLTLGVYICLAMSLMLFMERVYMGIVIILVKLFWKKPDKRYKWEPMQDDLESGNLNFPVVLVQIPMFNEREVSSSFSVSSVYFIFSQFVFFFILYSWDLEKSLRSLELFLLFVI